MPTQIQGIEFEVVGSGAEEAAKSLDDLAASLKKIKSAASSGLGTSKASKEIRALQIMLNDAKKVLTSVGKGALQAGKNILAMPFKSVADRVKSLNGRFSTLLSSLKRIAFYRIIRTIIKEIGQAFKDGMNNLYGWSALVGGQFKTSMDMIATSMLYLKNSIGAAVAPIVNALAPAIDFVVDKIVALINLINQLFALLSGATFWTRAKKKAVEYGDAVGGAGAAAKEALRYLAPFDELNRLPSENGGSGGGGGGADYSDMFEEMQTFDERIEEFARKLKEAFNRGDWKALGTLLGDKVNELVDQIPFADLGKKVGYYINGWFSTKYWTLETINFRKIGQDIATFLNNMLGEINFDIIGRRITQPFTMLGDFIIGALETVNWNLVGESIRKFFVGAFSQLSDWIDRIDWVQVGDDLMNAIIDFIEGLDPLEIIAKLTEFLAKVVNAIRELLKGMVAALWNNVVESNPWLENIGLGKVDPYKSQIVDELGNTWEYNTKTGTLEVVADVTGIKNSLPRGQRGALQNVTANVTNTTEYGLKKSIDNVTANLTNTTVDSSFPRTITGLVAQLSKWEKANGFNSKVSNMVSQFASWAKASGFGNVVNNMVSGFASWAKESGYSSTITDMVSSFSSYLKATGYPTTVTGLISSFTKWSKASGYSSTIGSMISSFSSWSKANGFDNTISGFTAALTTYLKQFKDPTINSYASITGVYSYYTSESLVNCKATIVEAFPELANDPIVDAVLQYLEYWNVPEQIITPGYIDYETQYAEMTAGTQYAPGMSLNPAYQALGGVFLGGSWRDIPQYANGGRPLGFGSLFIAGEEGPELVGHVGGRTEVLNRSQLAATMYASVNNAMRGMNQGADVSEDALYRAFRRALDETDFGGDVELDGEVMYRSMVRRNNQNTRMTGVNAFA